MTERIDHAAEARRSLEGSGDGRNFATDASANAIAHATLALVEQQRIANLIAYVAKWTDDEVLDVDAEIRERLGLEEQT